MNHKSNTILVQQAYGSFRTGDINSFLSLLAHDVRCEVPDTPAVPFAGSCRGRDEVARFFKRMSETQDVLEFELEDFIAQGESVVALGRFVMRIRATGREARSTFAHCGSGNKATRRWFVSMWTRWLSTRHIPRSEWKKRRFPRGIAPPEFATDQKLFALAAIRSTEPGVVQLGPSRFAEARRISPALVTANIRITSRRSPFDVLLRALRGRPRYARSTYN
ncbi:MAG TPA: nuclear transport factor 2 family protein [Bryobacteraceae bacterium]|nr:nuclear transport factor 2 family protein [Bryobacteraceae bacterium]